MAWYTVGTTSPSNSWPQGSSNTTWNFLVEYEETDISVANNTSKVTVRITLKAASGNTTGRYCSGKVTIDGTDITIPSKSTNHSGNAYGHNDATIVGSKTITHGSDGKKSITISASLTIGNGGTTGTVSKTVSLSEISRKWTVTASPSLIYTNNDLTIKVTSGSSSFTYSVAYQRQVGSNWITQRYFNGSSWGSTETKLSGSVRTITLPHATVAADMGSLTSAKIRIRVTTYNGSTVIDSDNSQEIQAQKTVGAIPLSLYDDNNGNVGVGICTPEITGSGWFFDGSKIGKKTLYYKDHSGTNQQITVIAVLDN